MEDKKPKKVVKTPKKIEKFDMGINEFGELTTTIDLTKITKFLDDTVPDRRLAEKAEKEKADRAAAAKLKAKLKAAAKKSAEKSTEK